MSLDEFKSAWNTEKTDEVHIPVRIQQLRKATHPLDKLKRNMKSEFYLQLAAIVILGFAPQLQNLPPSLHAIYYVAYTMLVAISCYYLNGFRNFYQQINHLTGHTKDSLTEIYYELQINIERYHSFGFLLLPFGLVWFGLGAYGKLMEQGKDLASVSNEVKSILIFATLLVTLGLVVAIQAWTRYYYGPYTKQLKAILDELKKDEL